MVLRSVLVILVIGFFGSALAADLDTLDMVYPRQPLENVTTGGQPSIDDLEYFASEGYTLVINIRVPGEFDGFDEEAVVKKLGMKYLNIPVKNMRSLTPENAELLHLALESATGPVLLHCTIGMRVSGLLGVEGYIYHGLSKADAVDLGKKAHMAHNARSIEKSIDKYERKK